jgi:DNA-binding response OmpR family regulator
MSATAWVVTGRKPMASRWARLLPLAGVRSWELSRLPPAARRSETVPDIVLVDWLLIQDGPERALKDLIAHCPGSRVMVFADEDALMGPALARVLAAGAADMVPSAGPDGPILRRLTALLRDRASAPRELEDLRVDRARHAAWTREGRRPWARLEGLTRKEFELLCFFMDHPGVCLTRALLMERLWAKRFFRVNPEVVDKHVGSLRRKLGAPGRRLVTRHGKGYSFDAE